MIGLALLPLPLSSRDLVHAALRQAEHVRDLLARVAAVEGFHDKPVSGGVEVRLLGGDAPELRERVGHAGECSRFDKTECNPLRWLHNVSGPERLRRPGPASNQEWSS